MKLNLEKIIAKILTLLSVLPLSILQGLGLFFGFILSFFPTQITKIAERNVELCYPELSILQKRKLVRKIVIQTVISGAEMPALFLKDSKKILNQIKEVKGLDKLKKAYLKEQGLICIGPHVGCWELGGLFLADHFPLFTLYTPPKQPFLDEIITKGRSRSGAEMAQASQSGVRRLFKALKDNKALALLTDQVPNANDFGGLYAPFFGIDAWTMNFPSKLYEKRKAPVFIVYAIRLGVGRGFKVIVEDFLPFIEKYQKISDCPDPFTYAMNDCYEAIARKYPSQYQWSYRRFKHPPKNHPGFYD